MKKKRRVNLRNVDVEKVLKKLGIEYSKRESELYARCPNPEHSDKSPSWSICAKIKTPKNGLFHCWSCKWSGNIFNLVMAVKGCSFTRALRFVENCRKEIIQEESYKASDEDYTRVLKGVEPNGITLKWKDARIDVQPIVQGIGKAWKYLQSRFIGERYIDLFGLMDWKDKQRIVIPIRRGGEIISWIARSYAGGKPKTLAPKNAPKRWELFGRDEADLNVDSVTIAEGWVDAIRLLQIGRPNPVALCGSKATEHQIEFLTQFKNIEMWLDGDKAGEVMAKDIVAWLGRDRKITVVSLPKGRDPGSYAPWELTIFEPEDWSSYVERRKTHG